MNRFFIIILGLVFNLSILHCLDNKNVRIIEKKKFYFGINNKDTTKIGLEFNKGEEITCISSIIIMDNSKILLLDSYHNNIKSIDINTGLIITSPIISKTNLYTDINFDSQFIYVIGIDENIYKISKDFKVIEDHIVSKTDSEEYDGFQSTSKYFININKNIEVTTRSTTYIINSNYEKISNKDDWSKIGYGIITRNIPFKNYSKNGKFYLESDFGVLELEKEFPNLSNYYNTINLDFNQDYITFFEIDMKKKRIVVNLYKYSKN